MASARSTVTPERKPYSTGNTSESESGAPKGQRFQTFDQLLLKHSPSRQSFSESRRPQTSSSQPSGTTRVTSTEEVIYGYSIGPNMPSEGNQDSNLSDDRLLQLITAAVTAVVQSLPQRINEDNGNGSDRWYVSDLGYFDPYLKKSYGEGDIVTLDKDVYYRNVILFVKRVRDLVEVKGPGLIRINLNTALRGAALT